MLHLINSLVRDQKFAFNETQQAIEQEWESLPEQTKDEFTSQDDFDIRFGPDKKQKMLLAKQRPDTPVKLKIKF